MCHSEICVQSAAQVYEIKIVGYVIAIKNFTLLLPFSLPPVFPFFYIKNEMEKNKDLYSCG